MVTKHTNNFFMKYNVEYLIAGKKYINLKYTNGTWILKGWEALT